MNKVKVYRQTREVGISPSFMVDTGKVPSAKSVDQNKKAFLIESKPNSPREFDKFWYESHPDFCEKNKKGFVVVPREANVDLEKLRQKNLPEGIPSYGGKPIRKAIEEITRKHWSQG